MHRTLGRFLKKLGLDNGYAPDPEQWQQLLQRIDTAFVEADNNRYTLERSLNLVSEEMQVLYKNQQESFEARQRAIVNALPDMMFMLDEHGICLEVMAGAPENMLQPVSDLIGRPITRFLPDELADRSLQAIKDAISQQSIQFLEYDLDVPVGKRYFESRIVPADMIHDGNKTVIGLVRDITDGKQAEQALRLLLEGTVGLTGQDYFDKVVEELCIWSSADSACISEIRETDCFDAIAMVLDGNKIDEYQYSIPDSPCELVINTGPRIYPTDVIRHFPKDPDLVDVGAHGYAGVPIHDQAGGAFGIIWLISRTPLNLPPQWKAMLEVIAARTGAEIHRMRAEAAHKENLEKYRALVETTQDFVWEVDANDVYTYCSPQTLNILGYRPEEIIGKTPYDLMQPDEAEQIRELFHNYAEQQLSFNGLENTNLHKDGHAVVLETSGVPFYDDEGKLAGYRGIDRDISDRKRAEQELQRMARFDPLTNLPNRHKFNEEIKLRLPEAERLGGKLSLLFIDLDNFKIINDSMGHEAGDELLRQVAERLSSCLRQYDTLARFGGDEFVLLLSQIKDNSEAAAVAEKLLHNLTQPFVIEQRDAFVSCSIGISIFPNDGRSAGKLLQHADTAMYRAKDSGRNGYRFFTQEMNLQMQRHRQITERLRHALDNNEFQLHYQPQVDMQTGKIDSCEALLRWLPDNGKEMSPEEFIPIAEKSELIIRLDEWVINEASRQMAGWLKEGASDIRIDINISGRLLNQPRFIDRIHASLEHHGLSPTHIGIELTENVLIESNETILAQLQELQSSGMHISIDDFGTGYSSLSYLKRFPVNSLKIDQEFVRDAPHDKDDRSIMEAIVAMGHSLDLKVVVEGIETEKQSSIAKDLHCDKAQGELFYQPMKADELKNLLEASE